ncbi:MAG TPA: response regulator transcription factor [Caldilineaceae bacterium]|nr:response regulator transcription factor [Caldilineaceae bacterium]
MSNQAITPIRILVVDDHPIVRDGLVAVLSTQPDLEVCGQADDGPEAVRLAAELQPDVILLDLEMPGMDGVAALQAIRSRNPALRAIVFTAFDTDERILAAVQAGAQGYLLKGAPRDELFNAIRVVHAGGSLLQPVVASRLLRRVTEQRHTPGPVEPLTSREEEVLRALAKGLQNKEIAAQLAITERTVKFHVSSIMGKLGAGNRTEVVTLAAQYGLIDL